jgi:hypothetical protein
MGMYLFMYVYFHVRSYARGKNKFIHFAGDLPNCVVGLNLVKFIPVFHAKHQYSVSTRKLHL